MALVLKPVSPEPKKAGKAKPGEKPEKLSGSLADVLAGIRKDKGEKVVVQGNKIPVVRRLATGIFEFDFYTGGGFPFGRYSIVYGPECLSFDTYLPYEVRSLSGKRLNHKGGTIEKLWHRFHGKVMSGRKNSGRKREDVEFFIPSMTDEGVFFQNRIVNVIDAGVKTCFKVITAAGLQLVATGEHKFFTETGFKALSELSVGQIVFGHHQQYWKGQKSEVFGARRMLVVNHHPHGYVQIQKEKYVSRTMYRSRLVIEALNNGLDLETYVARLNAGELTGLVFLPPELIVHHKNEDFTDDAVENLEVLTRRTHNKAHKRLKYQATPDEIVSIEEVGSRQTYDLTMEDPYNNYVAAGFVVHNSSNKTNLCLKAVAAAQRLPAPCNKAIWVNIEQSFDPLWATKMGVDTAQLLVVQAGYGEEAVDLVDALVRADDVALVVVDSMAGLIANKEIAQSVENYDIASSALLIKRMVNKLMIAFCEEQKKDHDPCVLLINQTRYKPGVQFGDPETMPGGEAQKFLASLRVRLSARNVIDKATNLVRFKDTRVTVKKAKIPVRAASFEFNLCVQAHDDLQIGETDSFSMVKSHLQATGLMVKTTKGYSVTGAKGVFPTLTAMQDRYLKDLVFRGQLQAVVIERFRDKLVLVESEDDYSALEVSPGTTIEVTHE